MPIRSIIRLHNRPCHVISCNVVRRLEAEGARRLRVIYTLFARVITPMPPSNTTVLFANADDELIKCSSKILVSYLQKGYERNLVDNSVTLI